MWLKMQSSKLTSRGAWENGEFIELLSLKSTLLRHSIRARLHWSTQQSEALDASQDVDNPHPPFAR